MSNECNEGIEGRGSRGRATDRADTQTETEREPNGSTSLLSYGMVSDG